MVACDLSRRQQPENLKCPRCDSSDTKFCYYNNYNTSQPRHFCKSCKRYWTAGGSLRNVPVGGGLRKNKKSKLLNQVKDMLTSSSSEELFQGNSLGSNSPYAFAKDSLPLEAPRPLSFAPPLYVASPSSATDIVSDGSIANTYAFRSLNPVGYGYLGEHRVDDFATAGMDPSLVSSMTMRQQAQFQADYVRALPEGVHQHLNGAILGPHGLAGTVQAQSHSGIASEVTSEPSQASVDVKDVHNEHSAPVLCSVASEKAHMHREEVEKTSREESANASVLTRLDSVCDTGKGPKQESLIPSEEFRHVEDNQLRDTSSAEGDEDDLGNVVNVRYPYDWEQVSEVLFGGTPDFFQLSGY